MNLPPGDGSPKEWNSILLSIMLSIGELFVLCVSLVIILLGISSSSDFNKEQTLSLLMLSASSFALALLLIPGIYTNIRQVFHKPALFPTIPNLNNWLFLPGLAFTWILCLLLGKILSGHALLSILLLPIINILGIGLPVLFYIRISLRGLKFPKAHRGWGVFGATLLVSPTMAFIFEGIFIGLIALFLFTIANYWPGLKETLGTLSHLLRSRAQSQDEIVRTIATLIFSPGAIASLLAIFSLAVPIIEESAKIIMILPILKRIDHPVDGYVLGILCGAAFAFVENLGFASAGSSDWVINTLVRSTSALPHIFNSGVLGWALVSAWKEQKYQNLLKAFLAVILIHGSWNAISLGFSVNELSPYITHIPFIFQFGYSWLAGWVVLVIGIFFGLIFINRRLQKITTI